MITNRSGRRSCQERKRYSRRRCREHSPYAGEAGHNLSRASYLALSEWHIRDTSRSCMAIRADFGVETTKNTQPWVGVARSICE